MPLWFSLKGLAAATATGLPAPGRLPLRTTPRRSRAFILTLLNRRRYDTRSRSFPNMWDRPVVFAGRPMTWLLKALVIAGGSR